MHQGPDPLHELQPQTESQNSGLKVFVAALAGLTLIAGGGAWLSHGPTADHGVPQASAQASQTSHAVQAAPAGGMLGGEFAMISPDQAAQALKKAGYSPNDQASILAGIKRREYRLVTMPIFDANGAGGVVSVQSGAVTRVVKLGPEPVPVVLPIMVSGEVQIAPVSDPGVTGIEPGAVTVLGPTILPSIHRDEYLTMTVIAQ